LHSSSVLNRPTRRLVGRSTRRLLLLAPSGKLPTLFKTQNDPERHAHFLAQLQRLRGKVYVEGGFLRSEDLVNGRHSASADAHSWHLLSLNSREQVCGCLRLRPYCNRTGYSHLMVSQSPIARSWEWGRHVRHAVEEELAHARREKVSFAELGGWALAEDARGGSEALRMALASFALSELAGGAVGVTTARERGSSPILRKIGGSRIHSLPPYYDRTYQCTLEILRFYSWDPNPRYKNWIADLTRELQETPVLVSDDKPADLSIVAATAMLFAQNSQGVTATA
jgi:hypothetical protein